MNSKAQQSCSLEFSSSSSVLTHGLRKPNVMEQCDQNSPLTEKPFFIGGDQACKLLSGGNPLEMFTNI